MALRVPTSLARVVSSCASLHILSAFVFATLSAMLLSHAVISDHTSLARYEHIHGAAQPFFFFGPSSDDSSVQENRELSQEFPLDL